MTDVSEIASDHAHIYFESEVINKARWLCTATVQEYGVKTGHMHWQPVGPKAGTKDTGQ